jgi:F-type H+-transporting ATPase subunit epsilon
MILDILTPEAQIFHGEVTSVTMPGIDGEFQVLTGHAAIISALKPGTVMISVADRSAVSSEKLIDTGKTSVFSYHINGGVAEMLGDKIVLLAD